VLQHPVTTEYGQGFAQIGQTLKAISSIGMQAAWLWPNVGRRLPTTSPRDCGSSASTTIPTTCYFYRNFSPEDYVRLLKSCAVLVGNSSLGIARGRLHGRAGGEYRDAPAGRERAENVTDVGYDAGAIEAAIRKQLKHGPYTPSKLFGDGTAASRSPISSPRRNSACQKMLSYVN
jgi:hypothetical protein